MEDYISVVTRYVHGANCSRASPFGSSSDEGELMDMSDDYNVDEDEQAVALLIEMRSFSAEEKRLMAQPRIEHSMEPVQANPSIEEEEVVKEPDQTLKKNTYEVHIVNKSYSKFEKNLFKRQSELFDCERENNIEMHNEVMDEMSLLRDQLVEVQGNMSRADAEMLEHADTFARRIQEEENSKAATEKEKNLITQGEDNSGRRGGGALKSTRSKRKPISDDSDRPIKRGGGRNGDRGGRSTRGDRGGRSIGGDRGGRSGGTGRGGRSLPLFHNLLIGEELSYEGSRFPIDPLIKREEQ
ncbi:keratin, type I cytoskeletal 10-like [Impatiens glandulifera]|uniref:keratin, type I cytoskeletal 10-like n=1 Tax=Impatiens glandulifera TaxID=253017 RepID=UPI001FB095DA|nr:keratin, type I cytoskeletal 10-like [Impatiens glandulifera]